MGDPAVVTQMARGGSGNLPLTHADVVKGSSLDLHRECDQVLEFRGWAGVREDGSSSVEWWGSYYCREVFCPEHGAVTTIRVRAGGGKDDGPAPSSTTGDTITEF